MKILLVQTAFLGDVVLATALLESLHAAYPEAELHVLVRRGNQALLEGHPFVSRVLVWDKRRKWASWWATLKSVRSERYTLLLCLQRFASMGALAVLSRAKRVVGFAKNPFSLFFAERHPHNIGDGRHEVARNRALLAGLPAAKPAMPRLYPTDAARTQAAAYQTQGAYVCIAPASVWHTKQWPAYKWAELIGLLPTNLRIYLIGGPEDAALAEQISAEAGSTHVDNLCGKLSIMGSAALIAGAAMTYCNDSGPLHLASATGAPVAAVFCSTVPAFGFGPLSPISHVFEEKVGLPCRPCGLHGYKACPQGHFLCARTIDPAALAVVL